MRLPSFTRKRKLRVIFWSGFALEIKYKIKQIIVVASVNNNFKDNFKRSAQMSSRRKSTTPSPSFLRRGLKTKLCVFVSLCTNITLQSENLRTLKYE